MPPWATESSVGAEVDGVHVGEQDLKLTDCEDDIPQTDRIEGPLYVLSHIFSL